MNQNLNQLLPLFLLNSSGNANDVIKLLNVLSDYENTTKADYQSSLITKLLTDAYSTNKNNDTLINTLLLLTTFQANSKKHQSTSKYSQSQLNGLIPDQALSILKVLSSK
jgi:hypothetical protein